MIKEMLLKDLPQVLTLEKQIFSNPWTKEVFKKIIENKKSYILNNAKNSQLLGYICGWLESNICTVANLAIDEKYHRKGLGTQLVKHLMQACKSEEPSHFYLEVRESNEKAIKFYKTLAFSIIGKRKNYYSKPKEDACLMVRAQ